LSRPTRGLWSDDEGVAGEELVCRRYSVIPSLLVAEELLVDFVGDMVFVWEEQSRARRKMLE
jgi:hypothetical protein